MKKQGVMRSAPSEQYDYAFEGSAADVTHKAKEINLIKNIIKSGCSAVGSAPALGAGCRGFESLHSDQKSSETERFRGFFIPFQPFSLSIAIQILLG